MAGNKFPFRNSSFCNAPATDGWCKANCASDRVCRPGTIDAEGRKGPIVSYGQQNSDFYVTTTETFVQEHVLSPFVSEHKQVSHRSHGPRESYQAVKGRWHSPSSPVHSRPQKVDAFLNKVHTEASKPQPGHFSSANRSQTVKHTNSFGPPNRSQTAKPTNFPGYTGGYGSDDDFNNSGHTGGYSSANRSQTVKHTNSFGPANRSQTAKPTNFSGYTGGYGSDDDFNNSGHTGGYSSDDNFNDHDWRNQSGKTYKNDGYDDNLSKHGSNGGWGRHNNAVWGGAPPNSTYSKPTSDISTKYFTESVKHSHATAPRFTYAEPAYAGGRDFIRMEPNLTTHGGGAMPSAAKWASPPNSTLSKPISDINMAMGVLKEAAQLCHSPAMNSWYTESSFIEIIDSTEDARRHNFNYNKRC